MVNNGDQVSLGQAEPWVLCASLMVCPGIGTSQALQCSPQLLMYTIMGCWEHAKRQARR